MTAELLAALFDYGAWANARLLDKAAGLPDAELTRSRYQGCASIHGTLVHMANADARWLARWKPEEPPALVPAEALPTIPAIRAMMERIVEPRRAYLSGLTPAQVAETIQFTSPGMPTRSLLRWQAIVQAANHGTQHRSEVAAMLSDLGRSPGDLDFSLYCLSGR